MKDVLTNEKFLAIFAITVICCWAMVAMDAAAKDIIIPAITGICGFVNISYKKQSPPEFPAMDEAVKAGTDKLQAAQVEAVKTEGDKIETIECNEVK
jgi:hypothetical protein